MLNLTILILARIFLLNALIPLYEKKKHTKQNKTTITTTSHLFSSKKISMLVTCLCAAAQASGVRPVLSTALTPVPTVKKTKLNFTNESRTVNPAKKGSQK